MSDRRNETFNPSNTRLQTWCSVLALCLTAGLSLNVLAQGSAQLDRHSVGLRYGEGEATSIGANIDLTLPGDFTLAADVLESEFSVFGDTEDYLKYAAEISTDPYQTWSARLVYQYSGNDDSLQSQEMGAGVAFYSGNWLLDAQVLLGEVELFVREEAFQAGLVRQRKFTTDRRRVALSAQYFMSQWQFSVLAEHYDYDKEINVEPTSLLALRVLGANSFNQLFGLLRHYFAADVGYLRGKHSWQLGYAAYRLHLGDEKGGSPNVGWDYQISDSVAVGALFALGLDESKDYGEVSLRYTF